MYSPEIVSLFEETTDSGLADASYRNVASLVRQALLKIAQVDQLGRWEDEVDDDARLTEFRRGPYRVAVKQVAKREPTGLNKNVATYHTEVSFSGMRLHPLARSAGGTFADAPGPERDDALVHYLKLADNQALATLKGEKQEGLVGTWAVPGAEERFGTCVVMDGKASSQLSCSKEYPTVDDARAAARVFESAAQNAGLDLDYAVMRMKETRMKLWTRKGSSLSFRVRMLVQPELILTVRSGS